VPTASRTRLLRAVPEDVWSVVGDPDHLPRWWPRVRRVEGVTPERWTKVMATGRGKAVRADERLVGSERLRRRAWSQELEASPFERVFSEIATEVRLEPREGATAVTLSLHQRLRGLNRLGAPVARRAAGRLLDEALDGLERACER
jgi:uncharacterized protein YndB with AHSA1/START domain